MKNKIQIVYTITMKNKIQIVHTLTMQNMIQLKAIQCNNSQNTFYVTWWDSNPDLLLLSQFRSITIKPRHQGLSKAQGKFDKRLLS
jgi:hypothetical protein